MNLSETARKQTRNIIQSQIVKGFFFKHGSNNTFWQTSKCIHYDRLWVNSLPIVVNINEESQQLSYTKTWHIGTTAG